MKLIAHRVRISYENPNLFEFFISLRVPIPSSIRRVLGGKSYPKDAHGF